MGVESHPLYDLATRKTHKCNTDAGPRGVTPSQSRRMCAMWLS